MKITLHHSLLVVGLLSLTSCEVSKKVEVPNQTFVEARKGFATQLIKKESEDFPAPIPPPRMFELITYQSGDRKLSAYLGTRQSAVPKQPAIIWLVGGFGNSISHLAWDERERSNDQSGSIFRKAGIVMMYPSLRGGNENGGHKEGFFGEVDDVLAAIDFLKARPDIDPARIFLGGHSTGGTLALLVAAAAGDSLAGVFALGPVDDPEGYGQEILPYSISDKKESLLRAPIRWLQDIKAPTFVFEGEEGNVDSLHAMQKANRNSRINFHPIDDHGHFDIIAPVSELIAEKILNAEPIVFRSTEISDQFQHRKLPPRSPFPKGDPRADQIIFQYAIYLDGQHNKKTVHELVGEFAKASFPNVQMQQPGDEATGKLDVIPDFLNDVKDGYAPPSMDQIQYKGRGLNKEQAEQLQKCRHAIRIWFRHPSSMALEGLSSANRFLVELEKGLDGILWDEQTREVFTPEVWTKQRIDSWTDTYPDVQNQITIHAYKNGEDIRAISLGMEKFGLPEVLIDQFSWSDNKGIGNLLNLLAQRLVEGEQLDNPDRFTLAIADIKNEKVRKTLEGSLIGGAKGETTVALKIGPWDSGDPDNATIEIHPAHHDGPDFYAQQSALLKELFGVEDEVKMVRNGDLELQAASERAKAKLPQLRKDFQAGYPPGQFILVKSLFGTEDKEWMWVEVKSWSDDGSIKGVLTSEPRFVENLKAGQEVSVKEAGLFDYILKFPDGTQEGNETGEIIRKMQNP